MSQQRHVQLKENKIRVIVCGGRGFNDKGLLFRALDRILQNYDTPEIVSGHARGADLFGEEYATERGLSVSVFKADWKQYGRAAGPIRNRMMLSYAKEGLPVIVAFWDGVSKGTGDMIKQAEKAGAEVHVVPYENEK